MVFLALGTIWFWLLVCINIVMGIYLIEKKDPSGIGATLTLVLSITALYFLGSRDFVVNIGQSILSHPVYSIGTVLIYMVIGVIWSFAKWGFWIKGKYFDYENYILDQKNSPSHYSISSPQNINARKQFMKNVAMK